MNVLYQSHMQRKQQQAETFNKENELLEIEKRQKRKDLDLKMQNEIEEFDKTSKQRLNKLKDIQRATLETFDKECLDKYSVLIQQTSNNRHSIYKIDTTRSNSTINFTNSNHNPHLSYFGGAASELDLTSSQTSINKSSQPVITSTGSSTSSTISSASYYQQAQQTQPGAAVQAAAMAAPSSNDPSYYQQYYQFVQQPQYFGAQAPAGFYTTTTAANEQTNSGYLTPQDLYAQQQAQAQAQAVNNIYGVDSYLSRLNSLNSTNASSPSNHRNSTSFN